MDNLESVIADSITDIEIPDTLPEPTEDSTLEVAPTPTEPVEVAPEVTEDPTAPVVDPTKPVAPLDDFDKKYGLAPQSSSGRENRIPYSRVKKIADNASKEAVTKAQSGWLKDLETTHVPRVKYAELETKSRDQETRLEGVARYEDILLNHPLDFLKKLVTLPQYAQIFNQTQGEAPQQVQAQAVDQDPMPQPDQDGGDGTKVYSMDGLNKLLEWNARQAEDRAVKKLEARYKPLEDDYKRFQDEQRVMPAVKEQISEARTWKLFNENEAEIVQVLTKYPDASLERAYQYVVWPKIQAEIDAAKAEVGTIQSSAKVERDKVRQEVLAELKKAPKATSAAGVGVKGAQPTTGPRSLEDVIKEQIKDLR